MSQFCKHFYFLHDVLFGCVFRLVLDLQQNFKKKKNKRFYNLHYVSLLLKGSFDTFKGDFFDICYAFHYIEIIH